MHDWRHFARSVFSRGAGRVQLGAFKVMATQRSRHFMIAKYQDFSNEGMRPRREWVILSDTGTLGSFMSPKVDGPTWSGRAAAASPAELELLAFACCPQRGVRPWNLTFRCAPNGIFWFEEAAVSTRAFLPMFVVCGAALEGDVFVSQLDRWANAIGV